MADSVRVRGVGVWRMALWSAAALLLAAPWLAMQFTEEVDWTGFDFAAFGLMLAGACCAFESMARATGNRISRAAAAVAILTAFFLVWINLAVGVIGDEDNPANLIYVGVLAVGLAGAVAAQFRPAGMALAMTATAVAQGGVAMFAAIAGMGHSASPPLEILGVNALFVALWLGSALLFRKAAHIAPAERTF